MMANVRLRAWTVVGLALIVAVTGGCGSDTQSLPDTGADSGAGSTNGCVDSCSLYGQACCEPDLGCVRPDGTCVFDMLEGDLTTPSLVYDYPSLEKQIAALPAGIRYSVAALDIAWAATDPSPSGRIELHLTAQASARVRERLANGTPFRFSCNGTPLFVGQFYMIEGAAALNTPVIHFSLDTDDTVILKLASAQGEWWMKSGSEADRQRIDRPELRRILCARGDLRELAP